MRKNILLVISIVLFVISVIPLFIGTWKNNNTEYQLVLYKSKLQVNKLWFQGGYFI